jgi:hypothetical protein
MIQSLTCLFFQLHNTIIREFTLCTILRKQYKFKLIRTSPGFSFYLNFLKFCEGHPHTFELLDPKGVQWSSSSISEHNLSNYEIDQMKHVRIKSIQYVIEGITAPPQSGSTPPQIILNMLTGKQKRFLISCKDQGKLSPSESVAYAAYIEKFIFRMSVKMPSAIICHAIVAAINSSQDNLIQKFIRRTMT